MWNIALLFLKGNWARIAVGLAIAIALGAAYAYIYRQGAASKQPALDALAAQVETERAEFALAAQKWNAERKAWDEIVADANAQLERSGRLAAERVKAGTEAADRERADFVKRMRDKDDALRIAGRALKLAGSAPAQCREYEADARLLPKGDRELLGELGYWASAGVRRGNSAVEQYDEVTQTFSKGNK